MIESYCIPLLRQEAVMHRPARLPVDCPRCENRDVLALGDDRTIACPLCNNWCAFCLDGVPTFVQIIGPYRGSLIAGMRPTATGETLFEGYACDYHKAALRSYSYIAPPYEDEGKPEVTYWLGKEYWGKGLATWALTEFLTHHNKTRPIYARVAKDNLGSRRVLEKCGFAIIGESRGFANARGQEIEEFLLELVE
jgi:Acetyltransferase (GNAT) domain